MGFGAITARAQPCDVYRSTNGAELIICVIGTRAQLIKMAPVMREMESRRIAFSLWLTGQHTVTMTELLAEFEIKTPAEHLQRGREVTGILHMALWMMVMLPRITFRMKQAISSQPRSHCVVMVHGDTFSTLLGAIAGRICRIQVAHVESGLRSFNLFHPFPEELTRLLVFRLSTHAFCPDNWAVQNLSGYKINKTNCGGNTLIDTVRFALQTYTSNIEQSARGQYGVVSIHRFENIFNRVRLLEILDLIDKAKPRFNLIFVLHPATKKQLIKFHLYDRLASDPMILLKDRMGYVAFFQLIFNSRFVITDGGSNQEELSYLGKPTLLMREATERMEGLNTNATLAKFKPEVVQGFIENLPLIDAPNCPLPDHSPSRIVVDQIDLIRRPPSAFQ